MPMIQCFDCGGPVSSTADACPSCGFNLKAKREWDKRKRDMKIGGAMLLACLACLGFLLFSDASPLRRRSRLGDQPRQPILAPSPTPARRR
jgi:hypothetical protein